jgi:hypothetical protein
MILGTLAMFGMDAVATGRLNAQPRRHEAGHYRSAPSHFAGFLAWNT